MRAAQQETVSWILHAPPGLADFVVQRFRADTKFLGQLGALAVVGDRIECRCLIQQRLEVGKSQIFTEGLAIEQLAKAGRIPSVGRSIGCTRYSRLISADKVEKGR